MSSRLDDLSRLSLAELIELQAAAVEALRERKARAQRRIKKDFSIMADKAGLTVEERQFLFG